MEAISVEEQEVSYQLFRDAEIHPDPYLFDNIQAKKSLCQLCGLMCVIILSFTFFIPLSSLTPQSHCV